MNSIRWGAGGGSISIDNSRNINPFDDYYLDYEVMRIKPIIDPFSSAYRRAKELFIKHLTPQQRKTFEEKNYIIVLSNKKHIYRIDTSSVQINIYRLHGHNIAYRRSCMILKDCTCPFFDILLAQKLILETDEDYFLKTANHYVWIKRYEDCY